MKNKNKIVVIGSSNTDMVVQSHHLPLPGETVLGGKFMINPGGKGANQAVAAAKLGGEITFISKVGNDLLGKELIRGFKKAGIDTEYVFHDKKAPSGVALIMVDRKGENSISVASGSNANLGKQEINQAKSAIKQASLVLVQLEIPVDTVEYIAKICKDLGLRLVLNPAPAQLLSKKLLSSIYIMTPNVSEAELLSGVKVKDEASARKAAKALKKKGVQIVIITMGAKGAFVLSNEEDLLVPSIQVDAVDTTAAGDTFNGALAVGIAEGMPLIEAIQFANKAAAISVTRVGAQASVPRRKDIN